MPDPSNLTNEQYLESLTESLEYWQQDGWELVAVERWLMFLKRPTQK